MINVKLLHPPKGPLVFKRMVETSKISASKGDIVRLISKNGEIFGYAFYNPSSNIVFRLISRLVKEEFSFEEYLYNAVRKAYELRQRFKLPSSHTNVFRLIHDWGDGLCGLTCDVFDSICVCEIYSYGYYKRMELIEKVLKEVVGVEEVYFVASSYTKTMERFELEEKSRVVRVKENDVLFEVVVGGGYKTGFFCDQRENRRYLCEFVEGRSVCDLFAYTGGFGIYAKKWGAKEVVCVELDEDAVKLGKRNANINKLNINFVRADAFTYLRQMKANNKRFDVVVCDPYKFINSPESKEEGMRKYYDINKLVFEVVKSDGVVVTSSCSGMLSFDEFSGIVRKAASAAKRIVRIFKKTGAGPDHPFMVNYPEGEYLKVLWCVMD